MNTFFLFFLPLTWALAKQNKTVEPFTVHSTVNLTDHILGLTAYDDKVILVIPQFKLPYQDIISGVNDTVFVSDDKAYAFEFDTDELIELNRDKTAFKAAVVKSAGGIESIASGSGKNLFVSIFTGNREMGTYTSTLSTYKDGAFTKLRELDGDLPAIAVSHNTKLYGILSPNKSGTPTKLIEISLQDKEKGYKVLATTKNPDNEEIRITCDKQGNIYVLWKKGVVEVYNSQGKSYSINSPTFFLKYITISNSEPQYLYLGGYNFKLPTAKPEIGRVQL
ncbi:hypothetical protein DSO57_1005689 [Entomophthora muscae]|uniref:Uncharacterized protein n=1 Tax=Entomophthora muscae TaxID=34485 RepID=A0ACC2TVF3_9FUNG|nr:hypothetical protein DSO57_1005689 [Entomophthora muscae]